MSSRLDLEERFYTRLESNKWDLLGSGAMAVVYGKESSPWVIKKGCISDPWVDYAFMILSGCVSENNPYFPKIKRMVCFGDNYYAIMERLDETIGQRRNKLKNALPGSVSLEIESINRNKEWIDPDLFEKMEKFLKDMAMYSSMRKVAEMDRGSVALDEDAIEVTDLLKNYFNSLNHGTDMHHGNAMYRGEQLVITDPVYSNDGKASILRQKHKRRVYSAYC